MRTSYVAIISLFMAMSAVFAAPLEYKYEDVTLRISGYGNVGMIEPDFTLNNSRFLGDWSLRGQMTYDADNNHRFGFVYSLDQQTVDDDKYIDDLFALWQVKGLGRLEIGLTDSVAEKLGLGLPDVGGLRMNDNPLIYKRINPRGPIIADTILDTGSSAPRINVVSTNESGMQYGLSLAGGSEKYDVTLDGAIKIRRPNGKTKTAYSLGGSFMLNPKGFQQSQYSPLVTADWRAQISAAMNLQYNSLIFALNARAIYDQNPIGATADGIILGTGISYDFLKYNLSLTYVFSDTGIWHDEVDDYKNHTVVSSFRYKYSEYIDGWISLGLSVETSFVSAGLRVTF